MGLYADVTGPPKALPQANLQHIETGLALLAPLSRKGHGPGLIIVVAQTTERPMTDGGLPEPVMKWAEEGYTVVEIARDSVTMALEVGIFSKAISAMKTCDGYEDNGKIGVVVYGGLLWNEVAPHLDKVDEVKGAVVYADHTTATTLGEISTPVLRHLAGSSAAALTRTPSLTAYSYPTAKTENFPRPSSHDFNSSAEAISHTRNLTFLKPLLGSPYFDLEAIWEEHTYYEFADRSVEHTMATMVQEPYVNHVPTMTGGIGRNRLSSFYRDHFIFNNSADAELELISRTVGIDRVIDEFIFKFTHEKEVDWLIPGIPPTGRRAEVPFTAVVNFRGDRLYHEHIAWDQGTVLRQLGLLPEYLPYPFALPGGQTPGQGKRLEYRVPVAGIETAEKLRDKNSVLSNEMFAYTIREVDGEEGDR